MRLQHSSLRCQFERCHLRAILRPRGLRESYILDLCCEHESGEFCDRCLPSLSHGVWSGGCAFAMAVLSAESGTDPGEEGEAAGRWGYAGVWYALRRCRRPPAGRARDRHRGRQRPAGASQPPQRARPAASRMRLGISALLPRLRQQRRNSVLFLIGFLIGEIGRIPLVTCLPDSVPQPESPGC